MPSVAPVMVLSVNAMFEYDAYLRLTSTPIGDAPPLPLSVTLTPSKDALLSDSKYMPFCTSRSNVEALTERPSTADGSAPVWLDFCTDSRPNWLSSKWLSAIVVSNDWPRKRI